ncbi:MAG TPA: protein translocase subunit SecD [Candidatus Limnocylindrales bacterium]|jgi:preprotein translocase subunit SecD
MRRFLPLLIVAVGLAALAVNFLTLPRPFSDDVCSPPTSTGGCIDTRLGLDLQGGLRGEYQALPAPNHPVTSDDMATIRTIIENRINQYGVAEPVVQTQGSDRVVVEIPGVTDVEAVRQLIGSTGLLQFVPIPKNYATAVGQGTHLGTDLPACPDDLSSITTPCVLFNGDQLASAAAGVDSTTGQRVVNFTLKGPGSTLFDKYASVAYVGPNSASNQQFAIVLDGNVVSAPSVNAQRFGGQGQIGGSFSTADVTSLVTVLKYGSLPLQISEVSFSQISATLGLNFLQQSILAGIIGIALVFIFMLVHYRLPGVVACVALIFYTLVSFAIFRLIPVTLTLAGVAAFVLSVGMAVDANILIFERTKEELRSGKTLVSAVEAGFNRAWNSIFDSNMSSIITATILFYFGSATIRGFALVLIIGVLLSMFSAITLSRMMLRWIVRQSWARKARLFGVSEDEFIIAAPTTGNRRQVRASV